MASIFDLPPEIIDGILLRLPGQAIQALRATCRHLNHAASPFLFPVLYLSCHPLDLEVFQLVAANDLLLSGVRELVIDDTTLAPSLTDWKVYQAAASYTEGLWSKRRAPYFPEDPAFDVPGREWAPKLDKALHELFMSVFERHHHNRRTLADVSALVNALPRMYALRSLVLSNRTADDAPVSGAQSKDSSSPTVRMWRRFGEQRKERPPLPPWCDWSSAWGSPKPRTNEGALDWDWLDDELNRHIQEPFEGEDERNGQQNPQVVFDHMDNSDPGDSLHRRSNLEGRSTTREDRGLVIVLKALESPRLQAQLREFRVDASYDIIHGMCQPGLPIRLFDRNSPFPDRLATQLGLTPNLTKLNLTVNEECMPWERGDEVGQGCLGRVLGTMPQLEELVFEAHGMATVAAIPDNLTFKRLRRVEFGCGHIDPEKLNGFLHRHAATLESLRIEYCSIEPGRETYEWNDVVRDITELQKQRTTMLKEVILFSVFGFKPFVGCGKNGSIRIGRRENQVYSWKYGVDKTLVQAKRKG
ncbi:hypothetical protein AK830_g1975 [Neonectria ditissima]|uniref:F-box domain-containing protein n=1 Tax=Neonectria ditissima TaxID=78410 RepID=A0A0P7BGW0_9HYPO|nr:hypothetical protein AK830_g1975 [Neonectria ditissima]